MKSYYMYVHVFLKESLKNDKKCVIHINDIFLLLFQTMTEECK